MLINFVFDIYGVFWVRHLVSCSLIGAYLPLRPPGAAGRGLLPASLPWPRKHPEVSPHPDEHCRWKQSLVLHAAL